MTTNRLGLSAVPRVGRSQQETCYDANARMLSDPKGRRDVHWYVHNDEIKIGWCRQLGNFEPETGHVMERDRSRFRPDDWRQLSSYLEHMGSPVRYRDDGERYEIEA